MFEFLFVLSLMCITYLVADFRRWLEIEDLKASQDAVLDEIVDSAFTAGYEMGAMLERFVYDPKSHLNKNLK